MRRVVCIVWPLLCACGPAVSVADDDTGSTSGPASTTSGEPPATVTSTTMPAAESSGVDPTPVTSGPVTTTGPDAESSSSGIDPTLDCAGDFIPPGPCQDECYRPIPGCEIDPIECSVWLGDCPDGEKCSAWSNDGGSVWNATRCVPYDPEYQELGEACEVEGSQYSGIDRCGPLARCWAVDADTNEGVCVARCAGSKDDPSCESLEEICLIANEGIINLCVPRCDPLLQDCPGAHGCYPTAGDFACLPLDAGLLAPEQSTCTLQNDCAPGTACSNDPEACIDAVEPCCVPYCSLAAPACPMGTTCIDALADGVVGVCQADG